MRNKKLCLIIFSIPVVLIGLLICLICFRRNQSTSNKKEVSVPKNISTSDETNLFIIDSNLSKDKKEVVATLSLKGKVSICRYSISLKYDSSILELVDYDEQLGVYSPVIYPPKDESGKIVEENFGKINLEWASANNISKESDIVKLKFKVKANNKPKTDIQVLINDVNRLDDSLVIKTEYNKLDSTIELK